jgi:broad specificity phosphatase PhoE
MMRRFLSALFTVVATASLAFAQATPTVVIVVRHAEKAAAPADDPPLTEAGVARAKALAVALANADVQAVITTQLLRTRETARPLAEARGLSMETVRTGPTVAAHAKAVADAARNHTGKTILVVGHSNTVVAIIAALGGPKLPDLCDSQYSTLFTVVLDGTGARLIQSTFGAPSPDVPTGCPAMRLPGGDLQGNAR